MARPDWMKDREIIDYTGDLPITINIRRSDIENAVPLNGVDCVAGRCTLRALAAQMAYFYRSVAYIAWDDDGPLIRYRLSARLVRMVIKVLDDPLVPNTDIEPGQYALLPVPPKQRLGVNRVRAEDAPRRAPRRDRGHRVVGRVTAARHIAA
jgi:hypothetical protein